MKQWVFYSDFFVPAGAAGCASGLLPVVFIRPSKRDDFGLLAHELKHVEQWYRHPLMHGISYLFDRSYRELCEVEAYREQLKHSPDNIERFASFLAESYRLGIDIPRARWLLTHEIAPGAAGERIDVMAEIVIIIGAMAMLIGAALSGVTI